MKLIRLFFRGHGSLKKPVQHVPQIERPREGNSQSGCNLNNRGATAVSVSHDKSKPKRNNSIRLSAVGDEIGEGGFNTIRVYDFKSYIAKANSSVLGIGVHAGPLNTIDKNKPFWRSALLESRGQ